MGQRVIPVAVTAEYIGGDGVTLGAAGSHNSVVIEYDFRSAGSMWDDPEGGVLIKYVLWTNPQGNTTNRVDLGVDKLVPGYDSKVYHASPTADAMCVAGWAEMVVVGAVVDNSTTPPTETVKVKTEPSRFRVLPGSSRLSDNEGIAATVADQLQTEIEAVDARKVNKPLPPMDPNGTDGQFLVSRGSGRTEWVDMNPDVVEEVLERHKDWVTTVEDDSLTTPKYKDQSVTGEKIADGSVTGEKIADGAISIDKLDAAMDLTLSTMQLDIGNLQSAKADKSELQQLEMAAATKTELQATKSELSGVDIALKTQIDQIIAPEGEAPSGTEILDARIGDDNKVYNSLGNAIRGQVGDLKSAILRITGNDSRYVFTDGYWIETTEPVGGTPQENTNGFSCCKISCAGGDVFSLTGYGSTSTHKLWCFIDDSGTILSSSGSRDYGTDIILTAPANAVYLIINAETNNASYPKSIIGGKLLVKVVNDFITNPQILNGYSSLGSNNDVNYLSHSGVYTWTSSNVPANVPVQGAGGRLLNIYYSDTQITQICCAADRTSAIYWRNQTGAGWGDWYEAVSTYDPYALPTLEKINENVDSDGFLPAGTYTHSITIKPGNISPLVVEVQSEFDNTGVDAVPYIQFECRRESTARIFYSHTYNFASNTQFVKQAWRIPNCFEVGIMNIIITVPTGTKLKIKYFDCRYDTSVRKGTGNVIFHAHRGFDKLLPPGSYNAYVVASELGFQSCVEIPKFTSDGVAVCFHNDGGALSKLSDVFTMPDGSPVPVLTEDSKISDFTYNELMQWSIGYTKNSIYADAKIMTMDGFLRICAETGMRPIFSIHPSPTLEQWAQLKGLLDKYKLSKLLTVKSGDTAVWKNVIDTFGDGEIYSIVNLVGVTAEYDIVSKIANGRISSGATNTRIDVEFFDEGLTSLEHGTAQMNMLANAVNNGYVASVVLDNLTPGSRIKSYMQMGVTEFTNCRHASIGLNW